MFDERIQDFETIRDTRGTSGEIDDQCRSSRAHESSGQRRVWGRFEPPPPNFLGDARYFTIDGRSGPFGRDISVRKSGATGRNDQVYTAVRPGDESRGNRRGLVGNDRSMSQLEATSLAPRYDTLPTEILLFIAGAPITHRENADSNACFHRRLPLDRAGVIKRGALDDGIDEATPSIDLKLGPRLR
jgi:hypothetical protein